MKDEEHSSNFRFSYGYLMQLGDEADSLIERDAAELASYGVDAAKRTLIATKTQELKDMPTDEELKGLVGIKTEAKDLKADELMVFVRDVMVRVRNAFGEESRIYIRFAVGSMTQLRDNDLYKCAKRVSRMSTVYITELTPFGVTPIMLTALDALAVEFDDAIDDKEDAVRERDISTQERVTLANELYELIVEVYDYGKTYWYTRDEAKYNDYIIYDAATPEEVYEVVMSSDHSAAAETNTLVLKGIAGMPGQIDWKDGTVDDFIFNGADQNFSHTYSTPGVYNMTVLTTNNLVKIVAQNCKLTSVPAFPAELIKVEEISMPVNQLTSFPDISTFANIKIFNLFDNKLNEVDSYIIKINAHQTSNGQINVSGANNSLPNGTTAPIIQELISRGWIVTTTTFP